MTEEAISDLERAIEEFWNNFSARPAVVYTDREGYIAIRYADRKLTSEMCSPTGPGFSCQ